MDENDQLRTIVRVLRADIKSLQAELEWLRDEEGKRTAELIKARQQLSSREPCPHSYAIVYIDDSTSATCSKCGYGWKTTNKGADTWTPDRK